MVSFVIYKRLKQSGGAEETLPAHNFLAVLRPGKIDHQGYLLWYQCHYWRTEYKCCSPRGPCSKFYKRLQPWNIYMASGPWQYRMVYTPHFDTSLYKYCVNYITKSEVLITETLFADLYYHWPIIDLLSLTLCKNGCLKISLLFVFTIASLTAFGITNSLPFLSQKQG